MKSPDGLSARRTSKRRAAQTVQSSKVVPLGKLHGVPVSIKINIVEGQGNSNNFAPGESTVIAKLKIRWVRYYLR